MKNTVILKWNPAISSYNMIRFLDDIVQTNTESDWSIWEHERVREGDIFYMLKVGQGQTGIAESLFATWQNGTEDLKRLCSV